MIRVEDYLDVEGAPVRMVERSAAPSPALSRLASYAGWLTHEHQRADADEVVLESARLRGAIRFVGPVEDRLLEPLVEILRALATGRADWDTPATASLLREELRTPIRLEVYVGPRCAYCPAVTAAALRFAFACEAIDLDVVRADLHPRAEVRSTPTVLVDGRIAHVGAGSEYPLAEAVVAAARRR